MTHKLKRIKDPGSVKKGAIIIYNTTSASAKKKKYPKEYFQLKTTTNYDPKQKAIQAVVNKGVNKGAKLEIYKTNFEDGIIFKRTLKK